MINEWCCKWWSLSLSVINIININNSVINITVCMWNLEKWYIWNYLQTRSYRQRYRELTYGYQGETGSGRRNWEIGIDVYTLLMGFPGGPTGKEAISQFRRHKTLGFDPCVGNIPQEKRTQPTAVFLSGKSHNRGAWWGAVHGVAKELDMTEHTRLIPCIN